MQKGGKCPETGLKYSSKEFHGRQKQNTPQKELDMESSR
jgi:hypothetical protein